MNVSYCVTAANGTVYWFHNLPHAQHFAAALGLRVRKITFSVMRK